MKKFLLSMVLLLTVSFILFTPDTKAATFDNSLDLNNLSDNVTIEEITYEEYISEVAKAHNVSEVEIAKESKDLLQFSSKKSLNNMYSTNNTLCTNCSLHRIEIPLDVATFYKPTIQIYAIIYNSGSFRQFQEIRNVLLGREYWGTVKQFDGHVSAALVSNISLYYIVNGNFRNEGTTSVSFTYNAKNRTGTSEFSFSGSREVSNLYKYVDIYQYYNLY